MFVTAIGKRQLAVDEQTKLKKDLIERLITSNMNEEAGDLIGSDDFNQAIECYLRGNCFEKAIKLCYVNDLID
jgi:hypothetical protein